VIGGDRPAIRTGSTTCSGVRLAGGAQIYGDDIDTLGAWQACALATASVPEQSTAMSVEQRNLDPADQRCGSTTAKTAQYGGLAADAACVTGAGALAKARA
jgi:hypothetical protein